MVDRWVLESNIWSKGEPKYILESNMNVSIIISGSPITMSSTYVEIEEELPTIDPGSIVDPQSIFLGDTPNMLLSGDSPSGNGTITYQWEERT